MINFFKHLLLPLRRVLTRLIIHSQNLETSSIPIDIASNYIFGEGVEGDYFEFGVFKGASFIRAYHSINYYTNLWKDFDRTKKAFSNIDLAKKSFNNYKQTKRNFYAFDSFEGLPEIKGIDEGHAIFQKGRYDCSKENFKKNLITNNVNLDDVIIVEGFYDKTLTPQLKDSLKIKKAAIIVIDCDLYESTKPVLKFITSIIDNGTIIIFDDWYAYKGDPNKGEQKACQEWIKENNHINLIPYKNYSTHQMSFIVNLKS